MSLSMNAATSLLIPNQLPPITFNGLAGPDQSWSCGKIRLISNAGSYLERLTSLCAPPEAMAQLIELVVQATEKCLSERTSDYQPTIGIGWWKGKHRDLLIYMEVSGEENPAVPLADVLNSRPDLIKETFVLSGVDHPLFGCQDTLWQLLAIGHKKAELRNEMFDLALKLCVTSSLRGNSPPEDPEDHPDGLELLNPSDPFQMVMDVQAILGTFYDWEMARLSALKSSEAGGA
jgi:hypothetical protein